MSGPDTAPDVTPVRVRVLHADDRPVAGATITVLDVDGRQTARGRCGDDGTFRTDVERPGEYLLIAAAAGHEPRSATLAVAAAEEHTVTIVLAGRHGGLTGVVSSSAGPLAGATVVVYDERGEVVATTGTDDGGRYAVTGLPPTTYTVVVAAPGLHPVTDTVALDTRAEAHWNPHLTGAGTEPSKTATHAAPDGPGTPTGTTATGTTATGTTAATGTAAGTGTRAGTRTGLAGTARTRDGRPVRDARVALLNADGSSVAIADTDADGHYTFDDLPPGDYTVITSGYPPVADVLRVGNGSAQYDPVLGQPDVP